MTACEEGLWAAHKERVLPHSPLPHARFDSECKRWNLEHVVLDLLSHIKTGKIQWLSVSCRGSGFCDLFQLFASFALFVVAVDLVMCAAVSEEAASDILVGAQPRIRCWARARSSSSELVDTATARRRQRVEDASGVTR